MSKKQCLKVERAYFSRAARIFRAKRFKLNDFNLL